MILNYLWSPMNPLEPLLTSFFLRASANSSGTLTPDFFCPVAFALPKSADENSS